jgi:glycerol-3-phosphate acyltransferase PlsY
VLRLALFEGQAVIAQTPFFVLALALATGFLLGSIPFGLILTKLAGTQDLRTVGSGNIGATNVLRTGRKGLAAATLLGDALKGTLAVLLVARFGVGAELAAAVGAMLGHIFPPWLQFRGGKGVATFLGTLLGVAWPVALVFAALWLLTAFITRTSSTGALVATLATPLVLALIGLPTAGLIYALLAALVWWKHRENISRLLAGTEPKIGGKR